MRLHSYLTRFVVSFFCLIALAAPALAQTETGQIAGTVSDATGAVVVGANVTARSVATQAVRTTQTAQNGSYVISNLLPGMYQVTVQMQGFSTAQARAEVTVGARVPADFRLEVGQTETIVEVTDTVARINTETQSLSATIGSAAIVELPSLTRNPYDFVAISGNISDADPTGRGVGYAINGQRAASTNVLLDGTANNDEFTATVGQTVPLDSVQEYSVITSNFTAEYGRAGGGVVNVATKGGTNEFHGTAYEFNRVSRLSSNTFENNANGIDRPIFTRNQFGYSVGGPIKKDKLFFFQNTEWIRVRSSATRFVWIATPELVGQAAQETRDFYSAFGDLRPELTILESLSRNQLIERGFDPCTAGSTGPCSQLSPDMPMFSRSAYSYPSDSGAGNPQNTLLLTARMDWNVSDKTQIYGRFALQDGKLLTGSVADSPFAGFDSAQEDRNQNYLVSLVHTFSPNLVSQSKLTYNRLKNLQPLGLLPPTPTLYHASGTAATRILGTLLAHPGYLPYSPGNGIPFGGPQNFIQAYEDLSLNKGGHNFRFGGAYVYIQDNRTFGAYENPVQQLGTNFGAGTDNFLRGLLRRYQGAVDPQGKYPCGATVTADCTLTLPVGPPNFSRSNRYHEFSLYAQDSWRLNPRFTVNLGVRWEYFGPQKNVDPRMDSNFYPDYSQSSQFLQIRNGSVQLAPDSPVGALWESDWNNFAPRVGFAWDLFGDGRTSLRGGYGIGFERNFGNVTFNVIQNPPNYAVIALDAGVDLPTIPISTDVAGPLAGSEGTKPLPRVSLRAVQPKLKTAYSHFWSASLERELGRGLVVAADYSGSKGVGLYSLENSNLVGAGNLYLGDPCAEGDPFSCTSRLRTTQYTNINRRSGSGFSDYHGLNFRVDVRDIGRSGLNIQANYTWSHAIDNLSSTFSESGNNYNLGLLDPFNPGLDKGDADFDIRQRFSMGGIWEVPFARETTGVARQILHGWQLAPIFTARTASPFTLYDTTSTYYWNSPRAMFDGPVSKTGDPNPKPVPDLPNAFTYIDVTQLPVNHDWVNPLTGTSELPPFPGNMTGRNLFRGFGIWSLNVGVSKNFYFTETLRLQLRGEFYNLFNHSNMYVNAGDVDLWAIERVTSNRGLPASGIPDRRNIQLAVKFIF